MRKLFSDIRRGAGRLPDMGEHPGTSFAVCLILLTGLAGFAKGNSAALVGLAAGFAVYGPLWAHGCVERARTQDRILKKRRMNS
ncbi:hypothetical protein [Roseivivax sp. CAU 1761]